MPTYVARMTYTVLAVIGVAAAVLIDIAILRTVLLRRKAFWAAYAIMLFFQLITNTLKPWSTMNLIRLFCGCMSRM